MDECFGTENGVYLWTSGLKSGSQFVWENKFGYFLPLTYTNWNNGEPNNHGGYESCVNIWPRYNYRWNDEECMLKSCFVCEL